MATPSRGRRVEAPLAGSPAEAAGLKRGDIVLTVGMFTGLHNWHGCRQLVRLFIDNACKCTQQTTLYGWKTDQ